MANIIACPGCQRRLHLPEAVHGETVQCPSCQTQFSPAEALPALPVTATSAAARPKDVPTLEHYDPAAETGPRRGPEPRRRAYPPPGAQKPVRGPWAIVGGLSAVVVLVVVGLFATAYALHKRRPVRPILPVGQGQDEMAAGHRRRGDELLKAGQLQQAAVAYRQVLDLDPKDAGAFLGLLRSLRYGDKRDDLVVRFGLLDNHHGNFDTFATDCKDRYDNESLELLAQAMRDIDPDYAPADYYLAVCKARHRQTDQAIPLFKAALAKEPDAGQRAVYVNGFLLDLAATGTFREAYAVAPDPAEGFRILAAQAKLHGNRDGLKQLLAIHGNSNPNDPLVPWYRAELLVQEERFALADKTFADALANPPDDETLASFRASRVLARYHTGQGLAAYREIGPRQETFQQLAFLAFADHEDDELQALLDAHSKNEPTNIDVLSYRCRMKVRRGKVEEGLAIFKVAVDKPLAVKKHPMLVYECLAEFVSAGKALEGYSAAPDAGRAFQIVAGNLLGQDRIEDLPALIEAHRAREPEDPWLDYYQAEVHLHAKEWVKAADVLRQAMKKAPEKQRGMFRSNFVFAMYKAGRGVQAYGQADSKDEVFEQLAGLLLRDKNVAELQALVHTHRENGGDGPELYLYDAIANALAHRPGDAKRLFRKAYESQNLDYVRAEYSRRFLTVMQEVGRGIDGYHAVPDPAVAFEALAADLVAKKNADELERLLDAHKEDADETRCAFYEGELHLLRDDPAGAVPCFAAAFRWAPPQQQWRYQHGYYRARVKAGQAVVTYQEKGQDPPVFDTLANLCVQEKDAKQLRELVDARRKVEGDDAELSPWELQIKWLNQDYEGTLQLLSEHRDHLGGMPRWRWTADDYKIRALVRLKRSADALREAEAVNKRPTGNRVLLVLANAATGDVKQTIAAMQKQRPAPYLFLLRTCYADEDLGPILRSEAFSEFREKFPEPKEPELRDVREMDD